MIANVPAKGTLKEDKMRADRLIAMLMLLQTHRRLTAHQLAEELEVSERTIYRDVMALNLAGIPIYTESGPGGGIALIENYQTDLTGLRPEEVQALSMLAIPAPLVQLGVGDALKAALLKLTASVPPSARGNQAQVHQRIHLDATWWFQSDEPMPHLVTIKQAVWQDQLLRITFLGDFNYIGEMIVAPYGLVAKASVWYLIYAHAERIRVRRISRILSAELLAEHFSRPVDFDLADFWHTWCAQYEQDRPSYQVQALVSPALAERLPSLLQDNQPDILNTPPSASDEGWQRMNLHFESFEDARTRLLGFGGAVEVLTPLALRKSIADYAHQVQNLYAFDET
jgi:predicted DNA-binding transcriptional regulator YafY